MGSSRWSTRAVEVVEVMEVAVGGVEQCRECWLRLNPATVVLRHTGGKLEVVGGVLLVADSCISRR